MWMKFRCLLILDVGIELGEWDVVWVMIAAKYAMRDGFSFIVFGGIGFLGNSERFEVLFASTMHRA